MNFVKSLKRVKPEVMDNVVNDVWRQLRQCLISEHAEDKVVLQIWHKVEDKVWNPVRRDVWSVIREEFK